MQRHPLWHHSIVVEEVVGTRTMPVVVHIRVEEEVRSHVEVERRVEAADTVLVGVQGVERILPVEEDTDLDSAEEDSPDCTVLVEGTRWVDLDMAIDRKEVVGLVVVVGRYNPPVGVHSPEEEGLRILLVVVPVEDILEGVLDNTTLILKDDGG